MSDGTKAAETPPATVLRSASIPGRFPHGFSSRAGGVSGPPFESLNLGGKWGDEPTSVAENRRRFLCAVGAPGPLYVARQVHGAAMVRVRAGDDPGAVGDLEADGLYTDAPGVALGVFVADCVPALIADPRTGLVAAVHAGWRGTVAGVLPAAVRALGSLGARPSELRVALGPAIGACCFEVGAEVVAAFSSTLASAVQPSPRRTPGKWHIDLKAANRLLLERAGVDPAAIEAPAACTHCDPSRFYSFRRDGNATGQMMGVIAVSSSAPDAVALQGRPL